MKKKTEVKKEEVKMMGVVIFCPTLNKNITLTENYSISAHEGECEMCGSHGEISMFVTKCECGKSHDIEISSW